MSTVNDMEIPSKETKVVKLHVDGARLPVNTLAAKKTGQAVSLVCPFPSLEVDVPVNFGSAEDGSLKKGTIHRIGVEDDPTTGLPRLRLSVRSEDGVQTFSGMEMNDMPSLITRESDAEFFTGDETDTGTYIASFPEEEEEAAWASYSDDLPTPEEIIARAQTRRRFRLSSAVAWCVVCMMLGAGGYMIYRTKVIDTDKIRETLAAFTAAGFGSTEIAVQTSEEQEIPAPEMQIADEREENGETAAPQLASTHMKLNGRMTGVGLHQVEDEAVNNEEENQHPSEDTLPATAIAVPVQTEEADASVEEIFETSAVQTNEARLTLPTRWKPEYSTSYRVRNPHGVVVDVPGALVQREGWLKIADQHPMVRSIKSVQRETGARFIVYVNGDLPRFMTSPRQNGVSLRLYHDEPVEIGETEKVALAQ